MIPLDDPIWTDLAHSYGNGSDVPPKLEHIEKSRKLPKAFWDEFTNTLCHQCTIGSASIAAFPHLVRIAGDNIDDEKGFDALRLASEILMLALGPENKMPKLQKELRRPFQQAISDGRRVVMQMYDQKRRTFTNNMLYLSMIAAFDLRADIGSLLADLDQGWYHCPHCEDRVEVEELCTW